LAADQTICGATPRCAGSPTWCGPIWKWSPMSHRAASLPWAPERQAEWPVQGQGEGQVQAGTCGAAYGLRCHRGHAATRRVVLDGLRGGGVGVMDCCSTFAVQPMAMACAHVLGAQGRVRVPRRRSWRRFREKRGRNRGEPGASRPLVRRPSAHAERPGTPRGLREAEM